MVGWRPNISTSQLIAILLQCNFDKLRARPDAQLAEHLPIRQVAKGEVCLEKNYLASLFQSVDRSQPASAPRLTERDKTVLRFILQGLTNKEIAARLEVSEGAVKASLLLDNISVEWCLCKMPDTPA